MKEIMQTNTQPTPAKISGIRSKRKQQQRDRKQKKRASGGTWKAKERECWNVFSSPVSACDSGAERAREDMSYLPNLNELNHFRPNHYLTPCIPSQDRSHSQFSRIIQLSTVTRKPFVSVSVRWNDSLS